jgi:hypothetical protein
MNDNDNQTETQEQSSLTPLQVAENLYADCILISVKAQNQEERNNKLAEAQENVVKYLDFHVEYWLQARAEFENIIKLAKK